MIKPIQLVLLAGLATACGGGVVCEDTHNRIRAYCTVLPSSFELLTEGARAGRYHDVARTWIPQDSTSNLHKHFQLCVELSALPQAERIQISDHYHGTLRSRIRTLVESLLLDPRAVSDENARALVDEFAKVQELVRSLTYEF